MLNNSLFTAISHCYLYNILQKVYIRREKYAQSHENDLLSKTTTEVLSTNP